MKFKSIKQMTTAKYRVNISWDHPQYSIDRYIDHYKLDLDPNFQQDKAGFLSSIVQNNMELRRNQRVETGGF